MPTQFILVRCPIDCHRGDADLVVGEEGVQLTFHRINFVLRDPQVLQADDGVSHLEQGEDFLSPSSEPMGSYVQ